MALDSETHQLTRARALTVADLPALAKAIAGCIHAAIDATPRLKYCGIWKLGVTYTEASLVTHGGALWLAETSARGIPGAAASGFRLIVKSGGA